MTSFGSISTSTFFFLKTLAALLLLLLIFPFTLVIVLGCWLWTKAIALLSAKKIPQRRGTVLLNGGKMTKSLQLARFFHAAGYRVIMVETHKYWLSGHRFSTAVDKFYTIPAPEADVDSYIQGLKEIVIKEEVNAFIPVSSPIGSYYDALAKPLLTPYCDVIHCDAQTTQLLDDKHRFCQQARKLGLTAPKTFLITNAEQILQFDFATDGSEYILKSIPYDSVHRLDTIRLPCPNMTTRLAQLPISANKPWVMQEFIRGKEYCTHSTVRNGEVRVYGCSTSSAFQVNYHHVNHPAIEAWVRHFIGEMKLTGQISFDFIVNDNGEVYPIECNPRTHTAITMFHDHPGVAQAYLEPSKSGQSAIEPLPNSPATYWLYHELWRLTQIRSLKQLDTWLNKIRSGTDAMFLVNDPLPILMVHHWQIPLLLLANLWHLRPWIRIDFNIGKIVDGGD